MNELALKAPRDLHKQIARRVHNWADVDDVAQEVYLALVRYRGEILWGEALMGTIIRRAIADYHDDRLSPTRSRIFANSDFIAEIAEEIPSGENVEARVIAEEQLRLSLRGLPPSHAAAVVLHEGMGMSYAEVARELDVKVDSVHSYLTQARAAIRRRRG